MKTHSWSLILTFVDSLLRRKIRQLLQLAFRYFYTFSFLAGFVFDSSNFDEQKIIQAMKTRLRSF